MTTDHPRDLRVAELLAVGSELTAGETRDSNGGDLARWLAEHGAGVRRMIALGDDLALVTRAFGEALAAADLVIATGGLGPTPDDLTREALAAAVGEVPAVEPALERHLRHLFERRGIPLPDMNLKQAWLIPSATSIPNPNGTAPGWWVDRPDGRVAILLPGPPREMHPMWRDWVLPRLLARGLGDGRVVRTLRLYGVGESHVAEMLGEEMLRRSNPVVATYARADWLDVRVSAVAERDSVGAVGEPAAAIVDRAVAEVRRLLGRYVWAEGQTGWSDLVERAAAAAGIRFAVTETGTHGALGTLLADVPQLARAATAGPAADVAAADRGLEAAAVGEAQEAGAEIGLALVAWDTGTETRLRVVIAGVVGGEGTLAGEPRVLELGLFQRGAHGRFRAGVAAAAFLVECLGGRPA